MTTPATQAVTPEDKWQAAWDALPDGMHAYARARQAGINALGQAHSLPGDVGMHPDIEGHIADAVRDGCGIVLGKVVSFDDSRGIAATIADRIKNANAEYAAALTPSALSGDAGEEGSRIIRFSDEKGDFVVGEDGCTIFWPEGLSRGGFNAWHLRALADELERRNADWLAQMRADFAALPSHKGAGE